MTRALVQLQRDVPANQRLYATSHKFFAYIRVIIQHNKHQQGV